MPNILSTQSYKRSSGVNYAGFCHASTNQSGHVTILSLTDRLNFSLALVDAEKMFIGLGLGPNFNP